MCLSIDKSMFNRIAFFLIFSFVSVGTFAQTKPASKTVNDNFMVWLSINSVYRFTDKWGAVADFHVRRINGVKDPSFWFIRFGAARWLTSDLRWTMGYANLWLAPQPNKSTWQLEYRYYNELLYTSKIEKVSLTQRLRVEQRWQEVVVNDHKTNDFRFTNRFRYLLSLNVPVFKSTNLPSLVFADEILLNAGSQVVYNTFDQNRLFIGVKQKISNALSFDLGYMNVYQQKASGDVYDNNHTIRWFFYYTLDLRKKEAEQTIQHIIDNGE